MASAPPPQASALSVGDVTRTASPALGLRAGVVSSPHGTKKGRKLPPPVPPLKKKPGPSTGDSTEPPSTSGASRQSHPAPGTGVSKPVVAASIPYPAAAAGQKKSPKPSAKKRRAPQPPTQTPPLSSPPPPPSTVPGQTASKPAALHTAPVQRSRSPKEEVLPPKPPVPASGLVQPVPLSRSTSTTLTPHDAPVPSSSLLKSGRTALPSIHAQDSFGPTSPIMDDTGYYSAPKAASSDATTTAPTSPPPRVPPHGGISFFQPAQPLAASAMYEEVVQRPSRPANHSPLSQRSVYEDVSRNRDPAPLAHLTTALFEYSEPELPVTSTATMPEYAEPKGELTAVPRPSVVPSAATRRSLSRSPDALKRMDGQQRPKPPPVPLPYSLHSSGRSPLPSARNSMDGDSSIPSVDVENLPGLEYNPKLRQSLSTSSYQPGGGGGLAADAVYSYNALSPVANGDDGVRDRKGSGDHYDHCVREEDRQLALARPDPYGYNQIRFSAIAIRGSSEDQSGPLPPPTAAPVLVDISTVSPRGSLERSPSPYEEMAPVEPSIAEEPREVYSEVQFRQKPKTPAISSKEHRRSVPRQDSDTSVGPPIEPYMGTPLVEDSILEGDDTFEVVSGHGMYSSIDDPFVEESNLPVASGSYEHPRRSRSLDDLGAIDETTALLEAKQEEMVAEVKEKRAQRVQQHSYEYVDVKPKPKPMPAQRHKKRRQSEFATADPQEERKAAERWRAEADRMRDQRMQRHDYDVLEPMRPRLQSFEAPAAITLETSKPSSRRPAGRQIAPIPAASMASGEELAWDDSDMNTVTSPITTSPNSTGARPEKLPRSENSLNRAALSPTKPSKSKPPAATETMLAPGWEEVTSELGTYYFHAASGVTQWSKPTVAAVAESPTPEQAYTAPASTPFTTSLVDEAVKEMTQAEAAGQSGREVRRDRWMGSGSDSTSTSRSTSSTGSGGGGGGGGGSMPITTPERMQAHTYYATSMGYVEVAESALTQRTAHGGCVMNCIARLEEAARDGSEFPAEIRLEDSEVLLKIMANSLKVVEVHTHTVLLTQSLQGIRLWGVSKTDQYVFAFVARDPVTQRHRCRIYRCKLSGKKVARVLRTCCDQILQDRKLKQDSVEKPRTEEVDGPMYNTPRNTRLSSSYLGDAGAHALNDRSSVSSTTGAATAADSVDPLLREDKECFAATYLGLTDVPSSSGVETIRNAISKMQHTSPTTWVEVVVEISAVKICLVDQKTQVSFKEHRVRFLTFLGMGADTQYCAYIMSSAKDVFWCHVFMCEKTSGKLVLALQKACKARFQRVLESQETEEAARELENKYLPPPVPAARHSPKPPPSTGPKPVPESSFLSMIQKLNRVTAKPGLSSGSSSSNPYFLSVPVKYYGSEDVGTACAGVKYVQEPFERLTSSARPVHGTCTCEVDSTGLRVLEARSKFDLRCAVEHITFVTIISNHICLIVDTSGRNLCHVIGPDKATVSLSAVLSSLEAAIEEHAARMCGGRQVVVNDTSH